MAKPTKKARSAKRKRGVTIVIAPRQRPSQEQFKRARNLLLHRADALVLELATRYLASKAEELTTVLDAMDSLAEFERMQPPSPAEVEPSGAHHDDL